MHLLAFLAVVAAIVFLFWTLYGAVFASGRRRMKLKLSGLGVILLFVALGFLIGASDQAARQSGFEGMADQSAAEQAGITDPSVWQEKKAKAKQLIAEQQALESASADREAQVAAVKQAAQDKAEEAELAAAEQKADPERAVAEAKEEAEHKQVEIEEAAAEKAKADKCRHDLQCWAEYDSIMAAVNCTIAIQALAKWDYEWTNGFMDPKFSRYRWSDKDKGIVTYIGNTMKMQNGFGAWKRVSYSCSYDPATKTVIQAEAY